MAVNVRGPFLCSRAAAPLMRRRTASGKIINISSATVFLGRPHYLHYVTSKAAVIGMTRALATELGPHGITVNALAPGSTETEVPRETVTPEQARGIVAGQAIGRRQVPERPGRRRLVPRLTGQRLHDRADHERRRRGGVPLMARRAALLLLLGLRPGPGGPGRPRGPAGRRPHLPAERAGGDVLPDAALARVRRRRDVAVVLRACRCSTTSRRSWPSRSSRRGSSGTGRSTSPPAPRSPQPGRPGRRAPIGVPEYQMTASVWIRGILADRHGLPVDSVRYRTGGLHDAGRKEKLAAGPAGPVRRPPDRDGRDPRRAARRRPRSTRCTPRGRPRSYDPSTPVPAGSAGCSPTRAGSSRTTSGPPASSRSCTPW